MTGLPDPRKSWAVLIGTSRYKKLSSLPAVRNNLSGLAKSLCDDRVWGLSSKHCVVIKYPVTSADMLDPLMRAADEATDTLLLYYAGHGLIDSNRGELHVALVASDQERIYTAVSYSHIRDALLGSRATRRIVILDCCYSGRALGLMGDDGVGVVVEEASAEGTYIMAAAAENKTALAPPGAKYTAFTDELLTTMQQGIPGRGELLDLDAIFNQVRATMRDKSRPSPQKRDRNTAGQLTLIRNQAYRVSPADRYQSAATEMRVNPQPPLKFFARPSPLSEVVQQPSPIVLKRPVLVQVSETAKRRLESLGDEVQRFNNPSIATLHKAIRASNASHVAASVNLGQTKTLASKAHVGFIDIVGAQVSLQNDLMRHYSLRVDGELTREESVEIVIPAYTRVQVTFHWKRIWATGMLVIAEQAKDAVGVAEVPFEIIVGLSFDEEIRDIGSRKKGAKKS